MSAPGPLAGIRIIDLTRVMAGPFATMLLGDAGIASRWRCRGDPASDRRAIVALEVAEHRVQVRLALDTGPWRIGDPHSRFPSVVGSVVGYVLLMTRMVPATMIVIPLYLLFQRWGLLDTRGALVVAYTTFQIPFATWMMKGYFDSIPREMEEAAQIDGCSEWTALWRVVLPLAAPGLVASVIASAILGWSDYVFARTLINSESLWTVTVGIQSFFGEHVILWNHVMASSLMATLPILVLFLTLGRYVVMGLTAGAVK